MISSFINANLMADLTTGISQTIIIHILNTTPIEWYSKSQYCVKTATYGSKYSTTHICTDQIVDLHNTLRCLGVSLKMVILSDASFMFGRDFSVVNSTVMPASKLQRRYHIINYNCTREA